MAERPVPRFQFGIFLSSTNDPVVKPFRLAAREVIESDEFSDRWYAEEMSDFAVDRSAPADICKAKVLDCAVYIGIVGPIYGSICQTEDTSYVEYEYQVAFDAKKAMGIFILPSELFTDEPFDIMRKQASLLDRQDAFRERVRAHTTATVSTIDEFKQQLSKYLRRAALSQQRANFKPPARRGPRQISRSFDRRTLAEHRVSELDQDLLRRFLESRQVMQELADLNLLDAPVELQLNGLGLSSPRGIVRGAFLCLALRSLIMKSNTAAHLYMVVYDGVERATSKILYLREESDNLPHLFELGMELFHKHLHWQGVSSTPEQGNLEIPEIVLREALANAFIHRDYEHLHTREQPTRIEIFEDRVEITSFGRLLGGDLSEMLNTAPEHVTPVRRNPIITRIFLYLALAELSGGGVARMHHAMTMARLPRPRIAEEKGRPASVRVTLYRRSAVPTTTELAIPASVFAPLDDSLLPMPKYFIGRIEEQAWVMARLRRGASTGITALGGMGGIGKTALAAMSVHALRQEGLFRDGIVVILCMGHTDPQEILQLVVDGFTAEHPADARDSLDSLSSLHSLLSAKDVLIVLDNIEPALELDHVVTPLRAAGAVLLITARHKMPSAVVPADGWRELDRLPLYEALDLFAHSARYPSVARLGADIEIAERIIRRLDNHTLAVRLAGAALADRSLTIRALEQELERDPLTLRAGESARYVERILQSSIDSLGPSARRLFITLSAFATEEFGYKAVIAVARKLRIEAPARATRQLIMRNVIDSSILNTPSHHADQQRLRVHPLLKALSARLFAQWSTAEQMAAKEAVALYYVGYTQSVAESELSADPLNIAGALEWACRHDKDAIIVALNSAMHAFWSHRWLTRVSAKYLPQGTMAADRIASRSGLSQDQLQAANLELAYAQIRRRIGDLEGAERALLANLAVRRALHDLRGEGLVLSQLGLTTRAGGRTTEAQNYLEQSVAIRRKMHDRQGEAEDLSLLGRLARTRGDLEQATAYFEQGIAIFRKEGDRRSEGVNLGYLAQIPILRGDLEHAEALARESLVIAHEVSNRRGEAESLSLLGQIARIRGRISDAEQYLRQSLAIRHEVLDLRGQGADIGLLGRIAQARGQLHDAQKLFEQSLSIAEKASDRRGEAAVLSSLGQLGLARGDYEEAEAYLQQSLSIRLEVQDRQGEGIDLSQIGRLNLDRGHFEAAEHYLKRSLAIDREMRDHPGEGVDLSQLGLVALEGRRYAQANEYLQQSLSIRRYVQDRRGEGIDLALLGRIALEQGRLDEAEQYFQQSTDLARRVQNRRGEGVNLRKLAVIAEARGEFTRAEDLYRSSLAVGIEVENGLDYADSLEALGRFLIESGVAVEAGCQMLGEALERFRQMRVPGDERVQALMKRLGC